MKWNVPIKNYIAWLFAALSLVVFFTACSEDTSQDQVVDSVSVNRNDGESAGNGGIDSKNPATTASWKPSPGDNKLLKEQAFVASTEILTLESYPPQFILILQGTLPTPCNELRVRVEEPDGKDKINVEAYSVIEPEKMCVQVLEEFKENIPLGTPPKGYYAVFVNGEEIGEIGYE